MTATISSLVFSQGWLLPLVVIVGWFFKEKILKYPYIIYQTWRRDLTGILKVIRSIRKISQCEKNLETIPKLFTKTVRRNPDKVAFYFEDEVWTFRQLEEYSNKIANYFISLGYEKGDAVALLLENRPEYVAIWMGLAKIGVISALINTNLVSKPLQHCISVANVKALIYGSDFENVVNEVYGNSEEIKLFQFNTSDSANQNILKGATDLKQVTAEQSIASPERRISMSRPKDKLLYIYTSGTTGLPKAATITNSRYIFSSTGIYYALELTDEDNFYNPLPLYHATGGMLTIGQCLNYGVTLTLRRKFSASNYWVDCAKYNCTVGNYIGEICRYILAAHKGKTPAKHGVKKLFGNGLKQDIWTEFVDTFNIPQIYEFYGATEGNTNMLNFDGTVGAVGFVPFYLTPIFSICVIKCDAETKQPIRDENGFCVKCKPGESGILIGIINKKVSNQNFDGYLNNTKETSKKIINDVFKKGDSYYNSGDIMCQDVLGYLYFKDRTGDTYRWKGENVATTEVELVISDIIGPKEIVVYGVEIPNNDGRAGMIAIADTTKSENTKTLAEGLKSQLPSYAVPIFLRLMDALPVTGTFKVKKGELQKEGFDIKVLKDPLYVYDSKKVDYVPLESMYEDIMTGKVKL